MIGVGQFWYYASDRPVPFGFFELHCLLWAIWSQGGRGWYRVVVSAFKEEDVINKPRPTKAIAMAQEIAAIAEVLKGCVDESGRTPDDDSPGHAKIPVGISCLKMAYMLYHEANASQVVLVNAVEGISEMLGRVVPKMDEADRQRLWRCVQEVFHGSGSGPLIEG